MLRSFLLAMMASCGVLSGVAVGGLQTGPIDTVTSVVSSVTAQTTVVSEATDSATEGGRAGGSGATDSAATDALSGGVQALAGGSSGVRPGKTFHSRFDRLPRRYELLSSDSSWDEARAPPAPGFSLCSPRLRPSFASEWSASSGWRSGGSSGVD
jgi:hypothetical protein